MWGQETETRILVKVPSLADCVTLGKSCRFPELAFPHLFPIKVDSKL